MDVFIQKENNTSFSFHKGDDIINKIIKKLQIFSTIIILSISSYNLSNNNSSNNEYEISIKKEQNIDDNLENYILQGLCKVDKKYLITAYDYKHRNNSIVYVLDEELKNYYIKKLDTNAHVGGITYDPNNGNIWVTDNNGTISAYKKEEIINNNKNKIAYKYKNIAIGNDLNNCFGTSSVAYITYYENKLYIGNYNNKYYTIIKEYKILDNGMIDTTKCNTYNISEYIQGITFYKNEESEYLIISSSNGRFFKSKLEIYDLKNLQKIKEIKTKTMMEEIIIDNNKLITLYESNAKRYKYNDKNKDIIISDINKLITK